MKQKLYSIYDTAAASYGNLIPAPNDALMIRSWTDAVNNPELPYGKHPEQYVMYCVGEYDTENAALIPVNPRPVRTALEVKSNV